MKKERQIGVRVGLPACFALEVEDVYRHTQGAHRALAFPDFLGLLIGLGLEQYRKEAEEPPENEWDIPEAGYKPIPALKMVRLENGDIMAIEALNDVIEREVI
jgi:hypothetical protein